MNISRDYNRERIKKNFEIISALEYLGIHIENTKTELDKSGFASKELYYFSVPEASTIQVKNEELNEKIKTSKGLISFAKKEITNMLIECCKDISEGDEEFVENVKNNPSSYFKFFAKVRVGEVWNEDMGKNKVKELADEIKRITGYKEV